MSAKPQLATDRREIDQDGRLRVPGCNISKANVCPYLGREIPGYEAMGLRPDAVYQLYRDPEELRKAAASFESIPLLIKHVPVTADDHEPDLVVGVVSNIRYEHPYLKGDVTVWTDEAKAVIMDESQRELSSAYRYTPVLGVGTAPDGLRYDITMRNLLGNHVALVAEGRAGSDVMVADSLPQVVKMKFKNTVAALAKVLGATFGNNEQLAFDNALQTELAAMDAEKELDDAERKAACDSYMKELGKDSLDDDETREAYRRAAADKRKANDSKPAQDAVAAPIALDEAAITIKAREGYLLATDAQIALDAAIVTARAEGAASAKALFAARDRVSDKAGLIALDGDTAPTTVEGVYRAALTVLKISHEGVAADALPALYDAAGTPAQDAAPVFSHDNVLDIIPALRNIRRG
jgi:hypothetical protein